MGMALPLPETANELCGVALNLDIERGTHVYLVAWATEIDIKQLSNEGALARYRIVHFATRGALHASFLARRSRA